MRFPKPIHSTWTTDRGSEPAKHCVLAENRVLALELDVRGDSILVAELVRRFDLDTEGDSLTDVSSRVTKGAGLVTEHGLLDLCETSQRSVVLLRFGQPDGVPQRETGRLHSAALTGRRVGGGELEEDTRGVLLLTGALIALGDNCGDDLSFEDREGGADICQVSIQHRVDGWDFIHGMYLLWVVVTKRVASKLVARMRS